MKASLECFDVDYMMSTTSSRGLAPILQYSPSENLVFYYGVPLPMTCLTQEDLKDVPDVVLINAAAGDTMLDSLSQLHWKFDNTPPQGFNLKEPSIYAKSAANNEALGDWTLQQLKPLKE
ncbi:hypothetical protein V6N13_014699 [Hibiscus sabdariffa]|uniref:Uncharacterized protein n=1 Tax=Hibiscus sabdariffa TaxID=183260 RepID=A0ABR2RW46_9ROSI